MNRERLFKDLTLIKPCLEVGPVDITSYFCFSNGFVYTFNGRAACGIKTDLELECGVPGRELLELISKVSGEEIDFELKKSVINIITGKKKEKLRLSVENSDRFCYSMPDIEKETDCHISINEDLIRGIKKCLIASYGSPDHVQIYGITIEADEEEVNIYATDDKALAKYVVELKAKGEFSGILPKDVCELIKSFSKRFEKGNVFLSENFIFVDFDGEAFIYGSLPSGDFEVIDFEGSILSNYISSTEFVEITPELIEMVDKASVISKGNTLNSVRVSIEGDIMQLSTESSIARMKDEVKLEPIGEAISLVTKCSLFKQLVKNCKQIGFYIYKDTVVLSGKDDRFLYMISEF